MSLSKTWRPNDYAFILDAGSSGTRLYVYEWRRWRVGDPGQPEITNPYSYKPNPQTGISKIVAGFDNDDNYSAEALQTRVDAHLQPIFEKAREFATNAGLDPAKIPLFLLGTAGIRDLKTDPKADSDLNAGSGLNQAQILRNARYTDLLRCMSHSAQEAGFNFKESGAISGEAEALYGWIASNYVLNDPTTWLSPLGYAEMGGASAQIAFSPSRAVAQTPYSGPVWRVKLGSAEYELFLGSYRLGMDVGLKSYFKTLIDDHRKSIEGRTPISDNDLSDEQKIVSDPGKPLGLQNQLGIWTLKGPKYSISTGQALATTIRRSSEILLGHRSAVIHPSLKPAIKAHKFIGGANFWYSTRTIFGLDRLGNPKTTAFSYVEFRKEIYQTLRIPWDNVKDRFPPNSYKLGDAWIRALWAEEVMYTKFGMGFTEALPAVEDEEKLTFRPFNGFEGAELTWTLGRVFHFITGNYTTERLRAEVDLRGIPYRAFLDSGDN